MLSAALRLLHRLLGAAMARIVLRRMVADGVPVTPEQRQQMARRLHREVVARRRRSYDRAVEQIRDFDPKIRPAEADPYPVDAVVAALERAVSPPRRPDPEPEDEDDAPPDQPEPDQSADRTESERPRARVTAPEEDPRPRARVADSSEPRRERARITAPDTPARRRANVAAPSELDPITRRRARSRVIAPTLENRTDPTVVRQVAAAVGATLTRHVAAAGRNAISHTALGAGEEIGWARVLSGAENCGFCAMLASRGPVYRSDKSALTVVGRAGRPRGSRALGERYHDNCVVPGTWISGPDTEVGYRRHYEGELVTLVTAAGHQLSITPQHPVLTDRGWIPAGLLNVGDKLVSSRRSDRNVVSGPDVDHVPARIEDVVGALGVMGPTILRRVPGTPEQFHGDGFDAEVDVVSGDYLLWDELDTAFPEPASQLNLHRATAQGALGGLTTPGFGELLELLSAPGAPARGGVGGSGLLHSCVGGLLLGAVPASGATTADRYARFGEPAVYDRARNAVVLGQGVGGLSFGVTTGYVRGRGDGLWAPVGVARKFDPPTLYGVPEARRIFAEFGSDLRERLAGSVHLDDLVDKRVAVYHGPVLNVATREGWYNANSIVVSNCDCEVVLVRLGEPWEGEAEYERLERLWKAASVMGGELDEEARRVFNRAYRRIEKNPELGEEIERIWAESTDGLTGGEANRAFRAALKANPPAALAAARSPRRATE